MDRFRIAGTAALRYIAAMFGANLTHSERLLVGVAAALTFAVFYVAGLQFGGHW